MQAVLEFRIGWNYESFHTLLAESLAHELCVSCAVLDRDIGGGGQGGGVEEEGVGHGAGGEREGEGREEGERDGEEGGKGGGGEGRERERGGGSRGEGGCLDEEAWKAEVRMRLSCVCVCECVFVYRSA